MVALPELNDMACFALVTQHQGFTAASKATGISKSLLSRRVAELESRLGVRLLQRTSRQFQVTDVGERYVRQCERMLAEAQAARQIIEDARAEPTGRLRISAPVMMAQMMLAPLISAFLRRYGQIGLEVVAVNRDVDLLDEGIDIAIRSKPLPLADSGLHLRVLGQQCNILVCSRQFLAENGPINQIEALITLPALTRQPDAKGWLLVHPEHGQHRIMPQMRLVSNNLTILTDAAVAGVGIALLPEFACRALLECGELQQPLPQWRSPPACIHAVFASSKGLSVTSRAFLDFLGAELTPMLEPARL